MRAATRTGLRLATGPDGDSLEWQAHLRRDEPRRVVLVLGPDVAHRDDRAVAFDRPTGLPRCRLELRLVLAELESLGQRHVERFGPRRTVALGPPQSVAPS